MLALSLSAFSRQWISHLLVIEVGALLVVELNLRRTSSPKSAQRTSSAALTTARACSMASERPARPVPHVTDASLAQIPSLTVVSADYTFENFRSRNGTSVGDCTCILRVSRAERCMVFISRDLGSTNGGHWVSSFQRLLSCGGREFKCDGPATVDKIWYDARCRCSIAGSGTERSSGPVSW